MRGLVCITRPGRLLPACHRLCVPLDRSAFGFFPAPPSSRRQHMPDVSGPVANPEMFMDHCSDPFQRPPIGGIAGGLRSFQQNPLQLFFLRLEQTAGPSCVQCWPQSAQVSLLVGVIPGNDRTDTGTQRGGDRSVGRARFQHHNGSTSSRFQLLGRSMRSHAP